nr:MAG TPA: hypothetical protein [Caudoviricetes sp.]
MVEIYLPTLRYKEGIRGVYKKHTPYLRQRVTYCQSY